MFQTCFCLLLLAVIRVKGNHDDAKGENSQIYQLLERMSALEERDSAQQTLIVNLKNELAKRDANYLSAIMDMQNELKNQKNEIEVMKRSLKMKDRRFWKLLRTVRQNTHRFVKASAIPNRSGEVKTSEHKAPGIVRSRRLENDVTVAFSAGLSKTVSHPGVNQNIVYDHVEINSGNGYNSHHGVFIAPVSGTYVFYTSIYASHAFNHDHIYCHFVVNGVAKYTLYVESTTSSSDTGSQLIITQLKQGDDVAVQLVTGVAGILGSQDLFSTFSGFLLQQNYSQPSSIVG